LVLLDDELNDLKGATGFLNGGTTGKKLLIKSSDAADPPIECDQVGAGPLAEWKQNGTLKASINNTGQIVSALTTGTAPFTVASTTKVTNLNADLLDGFSIENLATAASKVFFSMAFRIEDPSAYPLNDLSANTVLLVPAIAGGFITRLRIIRYSGSHTGGGSVTFKANIASSDIGSGVAFNDTNNAAFTAYTDNFTDVAISDGTAVTIVISARSGTISERAVSLNIEGYQTLTL